MRVITKLDGIRWISDDSTIDRRVFAEIKSTIVLFGSTIMFAFTILIYKIFLTAYFRPSYSVIISINLYNEANIAAIMLFFSAPFLIYSFVQNFRRVLR